MRPCFAQRFALRTLASIAACGAFLAISAAAHADPAPGVRTHDGFYFSLALGPGYGVDSITTSASNGAGS